MKFGASSLDMNTYSTIYDMHITWIKLFELYRIHAEVLNINCELIIKQVASYTWSSLL
jgi:hypothetical protein